MKKPIENHGTPWKMHGKRMENLSKRASDVSQRGLRGPAVGAQLADRALRLPLVPEGELVAAGSDAA